MGFEHFILMTLLHCRETQEGSKSSISGEGVVKYQIIENIIV